MRLTQTERVADLLHIEGGWWTSPELADRLGVTAGTIERALRDLIAGGDVEMRSMKLALSHPGRVGSYDRRTEWRHL